MGFFEKSAAIMQRWIGHPSCSILSLAIIVIWALLGPYYQYSDTWQLVINTSTTVIMFVLAFIIQNSVNRETREIHEKLDAIILLKGTTALGASGADLRSAVDSPEDIIRKAGL